jgi:hypothetical protein
MKIIATRRVEQAEVVYKNSEVNKVSNLCSKGGWIPCSLPTPVHRLTFNKALGKTPRVTRGGLDIMKGWSRIMLQRPQPKPYIAEKKWNGDNIYT